MDAEVRYDQIMNKAVRQTVEGVRLSVWFIMFCFGIWVGGLIICLIVLALAVVLAILI